MTRSEAWLAALRVRTWPAAVVPVVVGTALAAHAGRARASVAAIALVAALLIQVGTNLVNDWGDHRRGADAPDRLGPMRGTQAGILGAREVGLAGVFAFAAAALFGVVLVSRAGWPVLAIGLAAIAAGTAYTAGPYPLAYHGLGEAFVFAFFGPVAVCGTELVQAGRPSVAALVAAVPVGLLATAILIVDNVRDVESDRRAGKRTLVVRLGRNGGRALYVVAVALAFATPTVLVAAGLASPRVLLAWLSAPLVPFPLRAVLTRTEGPALNSALAATARLHLAFGLLFAAGLA